MAISTDDKRNLQRKQTWQTLLDFLLGLLEIEPAKSLERLIQLDPDDLDNLSDIGADIGLPASAANDSQSDILQALVALGYSDRDAALALKALPQDVGVSDGIKLALKALTK